MLRMDACVINEFETRVLLDPMLILSTPPWVIQARRLRQISISLSSMSFMTLMNLAAATYAF